MKKYLVGAAVIVVLLIAGFFVPLGSYTTTYGCQLETTPTARLHLIKGDSLNEVKNRKDPNIYANYTKNVTDLRTEMGLLDLANRRVERSTKEKGDAEILVKQTEEAMPAVLAASSQARDIVKRKQDELNQAISDYGVDSQQAKDKTKDLELAQYFLNLELINSAGKTLDVKNAQQELKDKTIELKDATRDYNDLLNGIKDGAGCTVNTKYVLYLL